MSLRRRLLDGLSGRVHPHLLAFAGSAYLSVRARALCRVQWSDGVWVHRYRDGVLVNNVLGGPSPAIQDRAAGDVFLHGYRPRPGDTVVDVGAGVGGEVRLFSRLVGPGGRVVSIEAHPETSRCLRRAVELNRLTNVTTVECAVVARPGRVRFTDDPAHHIGNGLSPDGPGIEVAGRTLGEVLATLDVGHVHLLKMNIEGAELEVLREALPVLDMVDNVVVSCHDFLADRADRAWQRTFAPVRELLRAAGYTITTRPGDSRPWVRYYLYGSRAWAGRLSS